MLAKTRGAKSKVLIVDDSRLVRIAASKMLAEEFEVVLAIDGKNAWDILQIDREIQVVFSDLVMPEMDGFELLQCIRTCDDQSISSLPVIVATGADNPEVAKQKALSLGATDFITKPFNATDLQARARSYAQYQKTSEVLKEQATLDTLTELYNTRGFEKQLEKEVSFVNRHQATLTVLSIAIDGFKDLFIQTGRTGANAVIKRVAKVLNDAVRKEDTVARTGVAEFAISMPLTQGDNALELAERICRTVEGFKAKLEGRMIRITVSIGACAATSTSGSIHSEDLLCAAELALEKARKLGRSQLYQLTLKDYLRHQAEEARYSLSIDELLQKIADGDMGSVLPCLDVALERLSPLLIMLSNEQKQKIFTYR